MATAEVGVHQSGAANGPPRPLCVADSSRGPRKPPVKDYRVGPSSASSSWDQSEHAPLDFRPSFLVLHNHDNRCPALTSAGATTSRWLSVLLRTTPPPPSRSRTPSAPPSPQPPPRSATSTRSPSTTAQTMLLLLTWFLFLSCSSIMVSAQSDYVTYYRFCSGQLRHANGNFFSELVCTQNPQTEFAGRDGGTMWRVITRSKFRNIWSVFELQMLTGATCNHTVAGNQAGVWKDSGTLNAGVHPISSLPNVAGSGMCSIVSRGLRSLRNSFSAKQSFAVRTRRIYCAVPLRGEIRIRPCSHF